MTIVQIEREKMGISQNELARRSGVKQSVISDIENEKTLNPRVETIMALANVLNFAWTKFYDRAGEEKDDTRSA